MRFKPSGRISATLGSIKTAERAYTRALRKFILIKNSLEILE